MMAATLAPIAPVRMTFRIHRFEVAVVTLATLLAVVVSAIVISLLRSSGYAAACLGPSDGIADPSSPDVSAICFQEGPQLVARIARGSLGLASIFPYVAGLLLGVPVIARELDSGTARLAWALSPSRLRWFAHRVLPILVLLVACAFIIGVVADQLAATLNPTQDMTLSFIGFRGRGMVLAVEAFLVGSISIALGAMFGKPVPAFVLSLILGAVTLVAVGEVHGKVLIGESVVRSDQENYNQNDLYLEGRFRAKDGSLLTWEEMNRRDPEFMMRGPDDSIAFVQLVIPGDRYRAVETRETLALAGIGTLAAAVAAATVIRRKPS